MVDIPGNSGLSRTGSLIEQQYRVRNERFDYSWRSVPSDQGCGGSMDVEAVATIAIDCGLKVHQGLGPGLLESAYEAVLTRLLEKRGLVVERQKIIPIRFDNLIILEGFRADLIVEGVLLIELKSVERFAPVHGKQVLTYLRLLDLRVGLLMNFGMETFREGLRRVVN